MRVIAQLIHTEMGLASEVNVTRAWNAMKLNDYEGAAFEPGTAKPINPIETESPRDAESIGSSNMVLR